MMTSSTRPIGIPSMGTSSRGQQDSVSKAEVGWEHIWLRPLLSFKGVGPQGGYPTPPHHLYMRHAHTRTHERKHTFDHNLKP